jgi:hypothetical protein
MELPQETLIRVTPADQGMMESPHNTPNKVRERGGSRRTERKGVSAATAFVRRESSHAFVPRAQTAVSFSAGVPCGKIS